MLGSKGGDTLGRASMALMLSIEAICWGLSNDTWRKCAFSGSAEWNVLLFLLCPSQSISLSGRKTLVRCLRLLPFSMPVELVRGGMAFGEANGWDVEGMFRNRAAVGSDEYTGGDTGLPRCRARDGVIYDE